MTSRRTRSKLQLPGDDEKGLVGRRVLVYWTHEKKFYPGRVVGMDHKKHLVKYDADPEDPPYAHRLVGYTAPVAELWRFETASDVAKQKREMKKPKLKKKNISSPSPTAAASPKAAPPPLKNTASPRTPSRRALVKKKTPPKRARSPSSSTKPKQPPAKKRKQQRTVTTTTLIDPPSSDVDSAELMSDPFTLAKNQHALQNTVTLYVVPGKKGTPFTQLFNCADPILASVHLIAWKCGYAPEGLTFECRNDHITPVDTPASLGLRDRDRLLVVFEPKYRLPEEKLSIRVICEEKQTTSYYNLHYTSTFQALMTHFKEQFHREGHADRFNFVYRYGGQLVRATDSPKTHALPRAAQLDATLVRK